MDEHDSKSATDIKIEKSNELHDEKQYSVWAHSFFLSKIGIAMSDAITNNMIAVNPAFASSRGYSPDELIGKSVMSLFPADIAHQVKKQLESVDLISHLVFESEHLRKDGSRFPVSLDITTLKSAIGKPINRIAYAQDITERKAIELALLEKQNEFRTLTESINQIVWACQPNGRILFLNQKLVEYSGLTLEQNNSDFWHKFFHPGEQQPTWDSWKYPTCYSQEHRLRRYDGAYFWWLIRGESILDNEGRIIKWICTGTNIEEIKQREQLILDSEVRYRSLIEQAADGIFLADSKGNYIDVNAAGCNQLGYSREELLKMTLVDVIDPAEIPKLSTQLTQLAKGGLVVSEWLFLRKDGSRFHGEVRGKQLSNGNLQGILIDITERNKSNESSRIAATAFETHEGMFIADSDGTILRVNKQYSKITGYSENEVVGDNIRQVQFNQKDASFYLDILVRVNQSGYWEGEIACRHKNGKIFTGYITISAVKSVLGEVTHYVETIADISLSKISAAEIQHLAYYDALTDLPNRRMLISRLEQALVSVSRNGKDGALLFLDLDNFKTINDTLGHNIGDQLLQQAAKRIESNVREGDTVARLGGDEFVVILENMSDVVLEAAAQIKAIGTKLLLSLSHPYQFGSNEYVCTSSIGVTMFGGSQANPDTLFKQADIAMYQAKKAGRNLLCFFDPQMQEALNARTEFEVELREAIDKKQFQLYYQVQVNKTGRAIGAEALIRWIHPERGLVNPAQFIPLAEETGSILAIGQWVLETACAQLNAWQQDIKTRDLTLSVNVSAKQFRKADFVSQIKALIQHHEIRHNLLKLELTESLLIENIEETILMMNELSKTGIILSLDDFGTGFSSLQYLKRLSIKQLKIDQSFVRDLASDESDRAIVRTIIAMAKGLKMNVIAEGVETEVQQQLLLGKGCDHFQGYLFGKPVPIDGFEASI
jgi:diguanylate cyclase (GGDEF)-like protein/PAS domain S-box-containing protein